MTDKTLHFIYGFLIAGAVALGLSNLLYGILAGFAAGIAKETKDYFSYGTFDFFDMFATMLGAVAIIPVWEFLIRPFI